MREAGGGVGAEAGAAGTVGGGGGIGCGPVRGRRGAAARSGWVGGRAGLLALLPVRADRQGPLRQVQAVGGRGRGLSLAVAEPPPAGHPAGGSRRRPPIGEVQRGRSVLRQEGLLHLRPPPPRPHRAHRAVPCRQGYRQIALSREIPRKKLKGKKKGLFLPDVRSAPSKIFVFSGPSQLIWFGVIRFGSYTFLVESFSTNNKN